MVSIAMKPNPFKEKIAGVKLFEVDSGEELSTLNNLPRYPIKVPLNCSIDLFNIQPETNYTIVVTANFPNGESYPVHATNIYIPRSSISAPDNEGYGKATGDFTFDLTLEEKGDLFLLFSLIKDNKDTDTFYCYYYFGGGINE
ncbi:hypothetical protein PJF60_02095 [Streptococcus thermophilus]|uniref:hypothetical protein n=1 Tax=Streptococcus thermophilus TaxID=1308 RepID=UPI0022FEAF35|nr:hypothetical protein [Streptococcus thermophilus]MDA5509277.1 hypothetical protein [Streptococcus thermophilus]MDA5539457.1 hypothetical protein [Streptococcus thermophilus]MDA5551562.1 hypothetical protein [Streptococcus thermophilus]